MRINWQCGGYNWYRRHKVCPHIILMCPSTPLTCNPKHTLAMLTTTTQDIPNRVQSHPKFYLVSLFSYWRHKVCPHIIFESSTDVQPKACICNMVPMTTKYQVHKICLIASNCVQDFTWFLYSYGLWLQRYRFSATINWQCGDHD